jgi:hypothetical protein
MYPAALLWHRAVFFLDRQPKSPVNHHQWWRWSPGVAAKATIDSTVEAINAGLRSLKAGTGTLG